ncbi:hypothetical protein A2U01_0058548, partial [Trifolium medium]|nr:hypothetical protein [Trifolium medium]
MSTSRSRLPPVYRSTQETPVEQEAWIRAMIREELRAEMQEAFQERWEAAMAAMTAQQAQAQRSFSSHDNDNYTRSSTSHQPHQSNLHPKASTQYG